MELPVEIFGKLLCSILLIRVIVGWTKVFKTKERTVYKAAGLAKI